MFLSLNLFAFNEILMSMASHRVANVTPTSGLWQLENMYENKLTVVTIGFTSGLVCFTVEFQCLQMRSVLPPRAKCSNELT